MTVLRRERLASYLIMISARTSCWWKFIAAQHGVQLQHYVDTQTLTS